MFSPCVTVINDTNHVVPVALTFTTVSLYSLSWPTSAVNFRLERATNLSSPVVWQVISNGIMTSNGFNVFLITNDSATPTFNEG
jgi:hypothetical protein